MNPYLVAQRAKYEALRTSIEGLQSRAADANRDLTEDELRSVTDQGAEARKLADTIESLTEIETRHAAVAATAAQVEADTTHNRETATGATRVGNAQSRDRDPGHYRRDGSNGFFADLFAARSLQDGDAIRRLTEHNRALGMATEGPGVIPPVWMSSEFAELARQQRRVAAAVRNIPLTSAAPISMPKQTAGTDAVVLEQAENAPTTFTNAWDSGVDTVSPLATAGGQKVSRQMLDSGNPAVDALIYSDLIAAYNTKVEAKVVAAMVTSAGAATVTYATEAAFTTALGNLAVSDDIITTATAVRSARKLPADVLVSGVTRYGSLLKMKDGSGRPLIPSDSGGAMNVIGTGSVAVDGRIHGLGVLASDGITAYPESILVARASDTILFESPTLRFRYEEPDGPEIIRLGIWAYTAVYVKYAGSSVKRLVITAA
ncbi:phage major capsid protein [Pseudonocardia broussonetiae]|uniref:Phage major capsid protein n=1 Tax=Pseudonocardia broussonetiae TaxID=2736640 RepID=A0A6M6JW77_9PSEU|nr:phage major capsid protein [Pseudonocardia broussonetiae]QJY51256.1 phage major capsid protein [Pseudonocardia broussonetiae]